jgi:hypothetical protein
MFNWFRKLDETVQLMVSINILLTSMALIIFIGGPIYKGNISFSTILPSVAEACIATVGIWICTYMVNKYSKVN